MLIQLPGGTAIDAEGNTIGAADNGEVRLHTQQALGRLIEFWKNDVTIRGLMADYIDEVQELENAIWDVIVLRLPDFAAGVNLDTLGSIVGADREGRGDAQYRVRIKAQIRINSSFGRPKDVIGVLRMVESGRFRYVHVGPAEFRIDYYTLTETEAAMHELPAIVKETRGASIGASVVFVLDENRSLIWNTSYGGLTQLSNNVWGSAYDSAAGATWAHIAQA